MVKPQNQNYSYQNKLPNLSKKHQNLQGTKMKFIEIPSDPSKNSRLHMAPWLNRLVVH